MSNTCMQGCEVEAVLPISVMPQPRKAACGNCPSMPSMPRPVMSLPTHTAMTSAQPPNPAHGATAPQLCLPVCVAKSRPTLCSLGSPMLVAAQSSLTALKPEHRAIPTDMRRSRAK